jgi:LysM repeat protein
MKICGLMYKSKIHKIIICLMIFILFSLISFTQPDMSYADKYTDSNAATSLTLRVGYSGGAFTEANVFTDSDFANAVKQGYSFMDSLPSPVMDAATGLPLTDLLSKAGIDFSKVKSFAFYCTDVPNRPLRTLSKSDLYAPRYYYPHIMEYWDRETQSFIGEDSVAEAVYESKEIPAKALEDAVRVYPMICISDNWQRGAMKPDFSKQDSSTKYRLVYGQLKDDLATINAPNALKWVYQIDVTLSGSPDSSSVSSSSISVTGVSLNKTTDVINVGSTSQLTATIAPTNATNKDVTWSSSNTAIATVSSTGRVTAVAPGIAKIIATTKDGNKTAICTVTVNAVTSNPVTPTTTPVTQTPTVTLNDIAGHWAQDNINKLVASGAIGGYPDSSFKPNATITRAEFATILVKAFDIDRQSGKVFADTSGHWAQEYISTAGLAGIVNGYTDNTFRPNDLVTREQMAAMIVKAAGLAPKTGAAQFADSSSISDWALNAVMAATENGVMKGYPDNTFKPQGNTTRAEAVTAILNALGK